VLRALLIGIVVLLFSSCYDKGDCIITNSNLINISLKKRSNSRQDTSVTFTSVNVSQTPITLYANTATAKLALPVDPSKTEATFVLNYAGQSQTFRFSYQNETLIPTSDCNALSYQNNVTIDHTTYDPTLIRIVNTQLLKNVPVNFEILF
jgi:hypothetical protein